MAREMKDLDRRLCHSPFVAQGSAGDSTIGLPVGPRKLSAAVGLPSMIFGICVVKAASGSASGSASYGEVLFVVRSRSVVAAGLSA